MPTPYRRTLARAWDFAPHDRAAIVLSGTVCLRDAALRLKPNAADKYPTTGVHYVRLQDFAPQAVRQWRGMDATVTTPAGTSLSWRIYDGTQAWWWDGGAWAVAGAGDWSSLGDVSANLPTFPITAKRLRPEVRLTTTDRDASPVVHRVVVTLDADVPCFREEVLHRTLLAQLRANVRVLADLQIPWAATGATHTLDVAGLEEPPGEVVDVVGAYDLGADPDMATNLLASFVLGTGVITLTGSVDEDAEVRLRVLGRPTVAMATSPDYDEIGLLPAVLVDDVEEVLQAAPIQRDATVDRTTLAAVAPAPPVQVTYDVQVRVVAARLTDLLRTAEAVEAFLEATPLLVSPALDARLDARVVARFRMAGNANGANLQDGTLRLRLRAAERWTGVAGAAYGVGQINIDGTLTQIVQ